MDLRTVAAGIAVPNPLVLASGTAGFGREVDSVIDLTQVGALTTKAVSVEPRDGNPALRVTEFAGGMLNAVGLANPGMEMVRDDHLGWLDSVLGDTRLFVNVVGRSPEDFGAVIRHLDSGQRIDAFELNVSCPNVKAGGLEFGSDKDSLREVVRCARAETAKVIFVKLSPTLGAGIVDMAAVALEAGASGVTLVNTMPGMVIDTRRRMPRLSFGSGGVSGPALLPIGLLATWRVHQAMPDVPIIGVGGISTGDDAIQYMLAGASLVGVGTAALRDPRAPKRIISGMREWCMREGVEDITAVVGGLRWPA